MAKSKRVIRSVFVLLMIIFIGGCASSGKSSSTHSRGTASHVNASQLGRNKYYYSPGYQKKLIYNYKKRK